MLLLNVIYFIMISFIKIYTHIPCYAYQIVMFIYTRVGSINT